MNELESMWAGLGLDVELHKQVLASIHHGFEERILSQDRRPRAMAYFDEALHNAHGERVREIIEHRERGGKFIGTFCIYVPEEIASALGIIPVALCGGTAFSIPYAETAFPRDICPLIKSTLGLAFSDTCPYAPIKDMAVGETTCDAKKKVWDVLAKRVNFHVMEVPQKKAKVDRALWRGEVAEFAGRLETLSGNRLEPEPLAQGISLMNRKRRALAQLDSYRQQVPPAISGRDALVVMQAALNDDALRFAEKVEMLDEELGERVASGVGVGEASAKRIMVAGCPSVMGNWKIHHLIESSGAVVVCDESCTGHRYFAELVEEANGSLSAQLDAIADRYFRLDCSCFSPNDDRLENVVRLAKEYQVAGVVQYVLQYCHGYNVEAINVKRALDEAGIPSLKIETDYSEEDSGQLRTRIEAFLEML